MRRSAISTDNPAMQKFLKEQEARKRATEKEFLRKRSLWEIEKGAPGTVSASLSSGSVTGASRQAFIGALEELVQEGTIRPLRADWKTFLGNDQTIPTVRSMGDLFTLAETTP